MSSRNTASSNVPWVIAVAAAAFAIGVATSDALRDAIFDVQDMLATYNRGNFPQGLNGLPPQAQVIDPSTFAAMPVVPPESIANITTVSQTCLFE
jgi:gluconolactonase